MLTEDVFRSRTLTVDGTAVTYYDSQDTKGRDEMLVLVHGTSGSTRAHFGFLYPILAAKQRVVSVDWAQPEGLAGPLELDHLVRQVTAVVGHVRTGQKVVLLGYSLGAVVTAVVAARHPELVNRLILVSGWIKTDLQQILRNDVYRALRALPDDSALREYNTFCAFGGPFLAGKTLADMQPGMDAAQFTDFGDLQMDLNRRIDIRSEAEEIRVPTLITGGTHDQMVPFRHQKDLFGAIADSRLAEIPTGHAVVFERPSELSHHIQVFMDDPSRHPTGTAIPVPAP
ncbi:alpha/beta hydrolase [Citricoccus sp. NPDC055426]|uniref:alpha/beta fold hydrolase n=1 Tax=Citricoccus sp. NPDC055426 TaxID=3155536 RepID=UPI00341C5E34